MIWFFIFAGIIIGIFIYNSLIDRRNKVKYALAGIDALLKKRADLVPNLVNTVKGSMKHERETLKNITTIRSEILKKQKEEEKRFEDESVLGILLSEIVISTENYPELKTNQNFLHLQASLEELEEQISAGRRAYNATVYDYNNTIEMFPLSLIAKLFGYSKKAFFEHNEKKDISINSI